VRLNEKPANASVYVNHLLRMRAVYAIKTDRLVRCTFNQNDLTMHKQSFQSSRDPEDRQIDEKDPSQVKDKMLDKTVADTFPASDPPSSLPDPDEDSFAAAGLT
jgi:hypothetical protein